MGPSNDSVRNVICRSTATAALAAWCASPGVVRADTAFGPFASEAVFLNSGEHVECPDRGCVANEPDGHFEDLDGGGATLRFHDEFVDFPLGEDVHVPDGADLVLFDVQWREEDPIVTFGYAEELVDEDHDGVADNRSGHAAFLAHAVIEHPRWSDAPSHLYFYDLDADRERPYEGPAPGFFLSVNDPEGNDFDLDAAQLLVPRDHEDLVLFEPVPGVAGHVNVMEASGGTPGAIVYFVAGFDDGRTAVPGCPDVALSILHPTVIGKDEVGEDGGARLERLVPERLAGELLFFQAVEPHTCRVSNAFGFVFER